MTAVACRWHDDLVDRAQAILVGAIERGSGPPLPVWACTRCATTLNLLPLDAHPDGSDGSPRTRTGAVLGPHSPLALGRPRGCAECARLAHAGTDPARVAAGTAPASLDALIRHHIATHDTTGAPDPDCTRCTDLQTTGGLAPTLRVGLLRRHLVMHALGITLGPDGALRVPHEPPARLLAAPGRPPTP